MSLPAARAALQIYETDRALPLARLPLSSQFVLVQRADNGTVVTKSTLFTTVPPINGTDCDESLLSLPFSAASLSNETARIGTPVFAHAGQPTQSSSSSSAQPTAQPSSEPTSGADTMSTARGYPVALAYVVAGIATFL